MIVTSDLVFWSGICIMIIGLVVMLVVNSKVSSFAVVRSISLSIAMFGIISVIVMGGIISVIGLYVQWEEHQLKDQNTKKMLDSLSCADLGQYIINNSQNSTWSDGTMRNNNFAYAEAKYLVCTHTPGGSP